VKQSSASLGLYNKKRGGIITCISKGEGTRYPLRVDAGSVNGGFGLLCAGKKTGWVKEPTRREIKGK